jgi:tetratricopeptide (TPR) repeat protein
VAILAQLYLGARRPRRVTDWDRERDVWQMFFNRGRAEITSDPTRLFFDTVAGFRQLNRIEAARIEQSGALYASCASVFCYSGVSFAVGRRALAIAKRLARPDSIPDTFTCAVMDFTVAYLDGHWASAPAVAAPLLADALRSGQLWDSNTYLGLRCDQHIRSGDFVGAQQQLDELVRLRDDYNFGFAGGNHDGMRAVLLAEARQLDEALRAIDDYLVARHEDPLRAFGLGTKAKVQTLRGDLDGAAGSLTDALAIITRSAVVPPWHRSAVAAARLRYLAARLEGGERISRRTVGAAVRSALRVERVVAIQRTEIYQLIGRIHQARGRRRAAIAAWRTSASIGESMGAHPELAVTYGLLARHLGSARLGSLDAARCNARAEALSGAVARAWTVSRRAGSLRAA